MPEATAYIRYGSLNKILPPEALIVTNSQAVFETIDPYNVKAVLQGHLHAREIVDDAKGCKYITSGAVCGNWWRGPRDGHPEGFSRFVVSGEEISWSYHTYGFQARSGGDAPRDIVAPHEITRDP